MKDVIHGRAPAQVTRLQKASGELGANGLGSIQSRKREHTWGRCGTAKHPNHSWLLGEICAVCSHCGLTVEKGKEHLYDTFGTDPSAPTLNL